jgi:hypothetical protein
MAVDGHSWWDTRVWGVLAFPLLYVEEGKQGNSGARKESQSAFVGVGNVL